MKYNKIYTFVNPGFRLKMLSAELEENSINVTLSSDGINHVIVGNYLYTDISSINISLIDVNQNMIYIKFNSGKQLKINSFSIGQLKDGKISRQAVDQKAAFNDWVSELHKILISKNLTEKIAFSEGSNLKALSLIFLLVVCIIGLIFAFAIGKFGFTFILLSGAVMSGRVLFKMGLEKDYSPESRVLLNESAEV